MGTKPSSFPSEREMRWFPRSVRPSLSSHTTATCFAGETRRNLHRPLRTWTSSPRCAATMRRGFPRTSCGTFTSCFLRSLAAEGPSSRSRLTECWRLDVFLEQGGVGLMIDYKSGFIWTHYKDPISNRLHITPTPVSCVFHSNFLC